MIVYNVLNEIIETILSITASSDSEVQFIWAGNSTSVPVVNEALKSYGVQIDCVIDNDKDKWDKEVSDVFYSEYLKRIITKRNPVFIHNPYEVIDLNK